jgi:uncharacterized protein YchJ
MEGYIPARMRSFYKFPSKIVLCTGMSLAQYIPVSPAGNMSYAAAPLSNIYETVDTRWVGEAIRSRHQAQDVSPGGVGTTAVFTTFAETDRTVETGCFINDIDRFVLSDITFDLKYGHRVIIRIAVKNVPIFSSR